MFHSSDLIVVFATVVLLFMTKRLSAVLRDLFQGGPRPPSHPLLGDDSRILTRRRGRVSV
jgi:hypothetical protein